MNYVGIYDRIIARARSRTLTGYRERHHVVPKCLGGTDHPGNLVELTAEEHYVAHQLLVKMYPGNGRIAYAAVMMAQKAVGHRAYAWLRMRHAAAARSRALGKVLTAQTREKIAAAKRGIKQAPDLVERRVAPLRGRKRPPYSDEWKAKIGAAFKGKKRKPRTAEHRANMSASQRGQKRRPLSPSHRAKIAASMRTHHERLTG